MGGGMREPKRVKGMLIVLTLLTRFTGVEAQAVRDSAGVRIVDNRAPAWTAAQRWRISAQPTLAIGMEDGEEPYLLSRVYAAARLPTGEIVIGNSASAELRFFGADGRFIRAAGRRGAGPGEFHELSSLNFCVLPGNELLVTDGGLRRLHVFSLTGGYKRTVAFEHPPEGGAAPIARV